MWITVWMTSAARTAPVSRRQSGTTYPQLVPMSGMGTTLRG